MHTDLDILALRAIGELDAATAQQNAHIESCAFCLHECLALQEVGELVRAVSNQFTVETAPPEVWDDICAELGIATTGRHPVVQRGYVDGDVESKRYSPRPPPRVVIAPETPTRDVAARRRGVWTRRQMLRLALVAVMAVVVGVGGTLVAQYWTTPHETVLAATPLTALPKWAGSSGKAELEVDSDGRRWLVVRVDPVRPVDGFQQIWLINTDVTAMMQIGLLSYSGQRFLLPAGVDISRYPVVDVSDEPATDDGAHSGNSIVRGTLPI